MTTVFTKRRIRKGVSWKSSNYSYGNVAGAAQSGQFPHEVQKVVYERHPGYRSMNGMKDYGGFFESYKLELAITGAPWVSRYNYVPDRGPWFPKGWQYDTETFLVASVEIAQLASAVTQTGNTDNGIDSFLSARVPSGPNSITMDAMGSKAIDLVKPTNPSVDLATSLAELWSERKFFSVPGSSGSLPGEYLNYQFGIAPTVSDFQDLRDTIANRDAIMRQYQRDSDKVIRRQYRFKPEVTISSSQSSAPIHAMGSGLTSYQAPGNGVLTKTTTTTQKFWFSGAFRYSIPKGAFPAKLDELDRLYGVVPGISTAWELVPFSWLVDYYTPIGSILSNMDTFMKDGLVIPYAYIMSTTEVEDRYDWKGPIYDAGGILRTVDVTSVVKKTRLRRRQATPFGFGLLATDLSDKQLSIIAALGMTLAGG